MAFLERKSSRSVTAVTERLDKLQRAGVLQHYSIAVVPKAVGNSVLAFMPFGIEQPEHNLELEVMMFLVPEVQECHHVTGGFNYLIKIPVSDRAHLEQILLTRINLPKIVNHFEAAIVFSTPKNMNCVKCNLYVGDYD